MINVGVIGLGRSGWGLHVAAIAALPGEFRLVAATDPVADRIGEAVAEYGCAGYPTVSEMVADSDVELVVVASPSHLHATHAVQALDGGKHVLVEKPFALSPAEASEMFAASERAGRSLISSQNLRYAADFRKVREVIASEKLGEIIQISIRRHAFRRRWDWQTLNRCGGGMINNDASHILDQALLLLGDSGRLNVTCSRLRTPLSLGDAEDHAKILLTSADGPTVDLEFSNACAFPQDQWLVTGTRGALTGGPKRLRWRYLDTDLLPARQVSGEPPADRGYDSEELVWTEEECRLDDETYAASLVRLYRRLHDSLRNGRPLDISPESVRRQIEVMERCRVAIRSLT
ncbi:Gfo/Idh/MocA family protein [Nonomuraea sp. SBT364]|uniref:Gfo/Idh/MocA family protein n=1 Tax=Nonomuraea sp. SBT364 TaxID=1580530 RepID=UPI000AD1DEA3|nr:Gfo/Idh/MocA family oxidoreductase [Nonomuraea sp. SBT364]